MLSRSHFLRSLPVAAGLALVFLGPIPGLTADSTLICRVVSQTLDGIYVDAGRADQLATGSSGMVERDGAEIARVEVVQVSRSTAFLRVISGVARDDIRLGDRVVLTRSVGEKDSLASGEAQGGSSTFKPPTSGEEPFVPLLAPPERSVGFPATSNIFSGRLRVRQLFQVDSKNKLDYWQTRFGSDGNLDRIAGTPWGFEWSGDVYYRDGPAYVDSPDYQQPRLDLFRLQLARKFDDGSFVRAGRLLARGLPGIGYIDGAQGEKALNDSFSLGAVLGFKPTRRDLTPSVREPTACAYVTTQLGARQSLYFSGTAGVLGSMYQGSFDRLAFLLDQRADLGPMLSFYSTTEVDVDTGGAELRSGTRLTRIDLYAVAPLTSFFTFRAGLDHYERLDTRAEREDLRFVDERYFDRGYWRYWIGGTEYLPWDLRIDEEVAVIDSPDEDRTPRWRASITRTGVFSLPQSQITLTVYNLDGAYAEGYGGVVSASLPFFDDALVFRPSGGFRVLKTDVTSERFEFTDLSLYLDWWISKAWRGYAGAAYTFGDSIDSTLMDIGVEFRW